VLTLPLLLVLAANPAEDRSVYDLTPDAFHKRAETDLATLQLFVRGISNVNTTLAANRALYAKKEKEPYTPEEKQLLLTSWGALYSYFLSIEGLRQRYWDFVKLAPTDARHPMGFLLTHAALTELLANGLTFAQMAQGNKQLETLLDEANNEYGVPQGAFANFKMKAIHVATSTQLMTGDAWSIEAQKQLLKAKLLDLDIVKWAWSAMIDAAKIAKDALKKHGIKLFLGNAQDILKTNTARTIFPVQKAFAEYMGDTRVARVGKPLIAPAQIDALLKKLEPGDVIFARQNWFLSNIGLPGFWPHAELYAGSAADLAKAFDEDAEVKTWVAAQPEKVTKFTDLLARRYPEKWTAYSSGTDFQGHKPPRIIEAISEGVSFTAVEHAFGVDYLGALRPRLSKGEKARAIEQGFKYQGRPYDFDFDFLSDSTLVCSEVVYKAYSPGADRKGLKLDLVTLVGRRTLPPTEIIKAFDKEYDSKDRQFDFVAFLDGREKEKKAVEADVAALRTSWKRPKWDVAQQ
jgi:hypothetical protein